MHDATTALRNFSRAPEKISAPRVLVVDDEPLIRWSVTETLTDGGYHVLSASDGRSAVQALADSPLPVEVVVLDLRLPDISDLSLLAKIRQLSPCSRVILMTAYRTPELFDTALGLGAFRVISKPVEMHELAALVQLAYMTRH
jgi:DNA-binding NtrC family response regulator